MSRISVIVVGFGAEPGLETCLSTLAAQVGVADELVVVDNGIHHVDERRRRWPTNVRLVRPGRNVGFAGGANAGATEACGSVLVFVNSDLVVGTSAVGRLVQVVESDPSVVATGSLRLSSDPKMINSAGNPVHFTGIAWAGGFGQPATAHDAPRPAASASGGFMAISRAKWEALDGFNADYFMYHEDVELSLRAWMTGGRVEYVPSAVAIHDYEFSRNVGKMYHLERNRLITVTTVYPRAVLRRVAPALFAAELGLLVLSAMQGWTGQKLRAYAWLWRNRHRLRARRAEVQSSFTASSETLTDLLSAHIDPAGFGAVRGLGMINRSLAAYWSLMRLR